MSLKLNNRHIEPILIPLVLATLLTPNPTLAQSAIEAPLSIPKEETATPSLPKKVDEIANNCYLFIKQHIPSFPLTKDLISNSIYPLVGGVAIMYYGSMPHYALITNVQANGINISESNFKHGLYTQRFLTWGYLYSHQTIYWTQI